MNQQEKRDLYRQICVDNYIPLHSKDWWLDAVCGTNNWEVAISLNNQNEVIGAFPFFTSNRLAKFTYTSNPILSIYIYIFFKPPINPNISELKKQSLKKQTLQSLIAQLPSASFTRLQFHPELDQIMPFIWSRYNQSSKYSYRLTDLSNINKIESNIAYKTKHGIKKTMEHIEIVSSTKFKVLYDLNLYSYERGKKKMPYSKDFLLKICQQLSERNLGELLLALDKRTKKAVAALFIAYDEHTAYALVAGSNRMGKNSPLNCLYLKAIRNSSERVNVFDFEGSMLKHVEPVYRKFGAKATQYHQVFRFKNKWLHAAAVINGMI